MKHGHSREEIIERLKTPPRHSYLRDWVYGGMDGIITTFAVVSSVMGAQLSPMIVLILGLANLLGDGFSMAASNFLGTKTEEEEYKYYESFEKEQTDLVPQGEKEEIRQIFAKKGFDGEPLDKIVDHITSDKKLWVDTMLREEYGLSAGVRSAFKAGLCTFIAFFVCGFVPLLPFIFKLHLSFLIACVCTGILFFLIGSLKSLWTIRSWWKSGIQTFSIGTIAAGLAYLVGLVFRLYII